MARSARTRVGTTSSYTSDANPDETSFTITDSFGLLKAKGGMADFPVTFHTTLPSKFCTPEGGLSPLQIKQRTRKIAAANDQFSRHGIVWSSLDLQCRRMRGRP